MAYAVKVRADSVGPHGIRLSTIEMTYPLIVHNELMTHRVFSRNTASNRAIPVQKMIDSVMTDPFIPEAFPKNQKGMQAQEWYEQGTEEYERCKQEWLIARNGAVTQARQLLDLNVHKQITNRLLGPFLFTTAVVSATEFANFANLRVHPDAQKEFFKLARMVLRAYFRSTPKALQPGEWHLPYITDEQRERYYNVPPYAIKHATREVLVPYVAMVSAGLCAGISYLRPNEGYIIGEKYQLALRLAESGHWSPFEHVAQCLAASDLRVVFNIAGNFMHGWAQLRKMFPRENQNTFNLTMLAQHGIHVDGRGGWVVEGED